MIVKAIFRSHVIKYGIKNISYIFMLIMNFYIAQSYGKWYANGIAIDQNLDCIKYFLTIWLHYRTNEREKHWKNSFKNSYTVIHSSQLTNACHVWKYVNL